MIVTGMHAGGATMFHPRSLLAIPGGFFLAVIAMLIYPNIGRITAPATCDGEIHGERVRVDMHGTNVTYRCVQSDGTERRVTWPVALWLSGGLVVLMFGVLEVHSRLRPASPTVALPTSDVSDEELEGLVRHLGKIQAIKFVREQRGLGLRDAKEYVERIQAR